jgi:hypothetical protein
MKLIKHVAVTLPVSAAVYYLFHSFPAFFGSLVGGVLIDIDHLFDYFIHEGINFRVRYFFEWCYKNKWNRITLVFHSIEVLFALWVIILYFNLSFFWVGLAIGMTQHLVLDIIFNKEVKRISYFFTLRFINGFKKEYILRKAEDV